MDAYEQALKEKDLKILELEKQLVELYNQLDVANHVQAIVEVTQLKAASFELTCLHNGGVDNWEWYHESLNNGGFFDDDISR